MGFLTDLVAERRRELERHPLDDPTLLTRAMAMPPARDFVGAIRPAPAIRRHRRGQTSVAVRGAIADRTRERRRAYASAARRRDLGADRTAHSTARSRIFAPRRCGDRRCSARTSDPPLRPVSQSDWVLDSGLSC
jgi:hypothetical protein